VIKLSQVDTTLLEYDFDKEEEILDDVSESPPDSTYEVSFCIGPDIHVDPVDLNPAGDAEEIEFAKELFEEMFDTIVSPAPEEYYLEEDTYTFRIPKEELIELITKITQYADIEGQDFIPLTDNLVAFNFSLIDPTGSDPRFPRSEEFEDEIPFPDWETKLRGE
jgi:hypothetical protein